MIRLAFAIAASLAVTTAHAKPVAVTRDSKTLEFSFSWPAEAAADRTLNARFRNDMQTAHAETSRNAADDQASAAKDRRDFHRHEYSMAWRTAGQSRRLLALRGELSEYSGGAHPNSATNGLIWDRRAKMEMGIGTLFTRAATFESLTRKAYCAALGKERSKRRQGEHLGGGFDDCPKYSELAILPIDRNRNGRFDILQFVASPYVAGPYVEGRYEIALPVTRRLLAAFKPQYRSSFEAQRQ